jgi:hypothetical protein
MQDDSDTIQVLHPYPCARSHAAAAVAGTGQHWVATVAAAGLVDQLLAGDSRVLARGAHTACVLVAVVPMAVAAGGSLAVHARLALEALRLLDVRGLVTERLGLAEGE